MDRKKGVLDIRLTRLSSGGTRGVAERQTKWMKNKWVFFLLFFYMSHHFGVFELTQAVCVDWKLDALTQDS